VPRKNIVRLPFALTQVFFHLFRQKHFQLGNKTRFPMEYLPLPPVYVPGGNNPNLFISYGEHNK
jgi:hypothetical protein